MNELICMKVPGIEGSFHQRTIKDSKTGKVKGKYWFHYAYDPTTKKMKSKRQDPPKDYLSKESLEVDNELTSNEIEVHPKDTILPEKLEALIAQILTAPNGSPLKKAIRIPTFTKTHLIPLLIHHVYEEIRHSEPGFTGLIPLNLLKQHLAGIPNEVIDQVLLDLERNRVVDLQVAYDPSNATGNEYGIPSEKGLLMYLRWRE